MKDFEEFKQTPEYVALYRKLDDYKTTYMEDIISLLRTNDVQGATVMAGRILMIDEFANVLREALDAKSKL